MNCSLTQPSRAVGHAGSHRWSRVRKPPACAASGGVDPDVRRAKVGKTHASGSRAVDAAPDAPRAAPVKHQITLQEAEAIFFVRGLCGLCL